MAGDSYQRVECDDCPFEKEGQTALMLGKKHAMDKEHNVFWLQEHSGYWRFREE